MHNNGSIYYAPPACVYRLKDAEDNHCKKKKCLLTRVKALGDCGGIHQVACTEAARDVGVDITNGHSTLKWDEKQTEYKM